MTGVTETHLRFREVIRFGQQTVGKALCLEPVNHEFSTIATMIGVQHIIMVTQVKRCQFLDPVLTNWGRIALLSPFRLKESRLSVGHAIERTTHTQKLRLGGPLVRICRALRQHAL
jgi:hypothetical protein